MVGDGSATVTVGSETMAHGGSMMAAGMLSVELRHISDNIQIPQHGGLQASNKRVETFVKRKGALLS